MILLNVCGCLLQCHLDFPFEFRALEVVLEAICTTLDACTKELESDAYPALDELTSKVKRLVLLYPLRPHNYFKINVSSYIDGRETCVDSFVQRLELFADQQS